MPLITSGGTPHTSQVTITTSPTLIAPFRDGSDAEPYRSAIVIQQAGSADVTLGGSDVVAGTGYVLRGNPDGTSQPAEFCNSTSNRAIYGIVASGTGTVNLYSEY